VFISSGYARGCALFKIARDGTGGFQARRAWESNELCNHFSTSVRHQDHLYSFDERRNLTCLNLRTCEVRWRQAGFHKGSLLLVNDYLLLLGETGKLALAKADPGEYVEIASGRPLVTSRCWTMPVLADGKLFLRDESQVMCLRLSN
jgi:hypothetical protein